MPSRAPASLNRSPLHRSPQHCSPQHWALRPLGLAPALLLAACGGGSGAVKVTAWAEDTVIEGMETDDGWAVSFDHWVTGLGELHLDGVDKGETVAEVEGPWVADWAAAPSLLELSVIEDLPAERYDFGFMTHPIIAESDPLTAIPDGVLETMLAEGYVHHIAGSATKGGATLRFAWGFDAAVDYERCTNGEDGTSGVAVPDSGEVEAQIWLHADHLLWDQLGTEEAGLAFDGIAAADADGDLTITAEELAAVDLVSAGYETAGVDVDNLYEFITFSVSQMAHLNGGGGCTARGGEAHEH
jgi:hypothetical protein